MQSESSALLRTAATLLLRDDLVRPIGQIALLLFTPLIPLQSWGAAKGKYNFTGIVEIKNYRHIDGPDIPLIQVDYRFSVFLGEPLESYRFRYEAPDDFKRITGIKLRARVAVS